MLASADIEHPRLTNCESTSEQILTCVRLCDYDTSTLQTDGRTDDRRLAVAIDEIAYQRCRPKV